MTLADPYKHKRVAKITKWTKILGNERKKRESDVDWPDMESKMAKYTKSRKLYEKKLISRAEIGHKLSESPLGKVLYNHRENNIIEPKLNPNREFKSKIRKYNIAESVSKEEDDIEL